MALKFLNKKGWHTGSLRNIENVWKAEQKQEAEQRKLEELRKQIHEEREREEFRLLQEQAGIAPRQERLEFLYDSGLAVGKTSSEGFKALEAFPSADNSAPASAPASASASASEPSSSKQSAVPGALFEDKPQSANDAWRKLHSDPLLMIRQREQEALARIKNNPVKMAMIRKSVKLEKKNDESHDGERQKVKSKHKKHSSSKHYSESESDGHEVGERKRRMKHKKKEHKSDDSESNEERGRKKKVKNEMKEYQDSEEDSGDRGLHREYESVNQQRHRSPVRQNLGRFKDDEQRRRGYEKSKHDQDSDEDSRDSTRNHRHSHRHYESEKQQHSSPVRQFDRYKDVERTRSKYDKSKLNQDSDEDSRDGTRHHRHSHRDYESGKQQRSSPVRLKSDRDKDGERTQYEKSKHEEYRSDHHKDNDRSHQTNGFKHTALPPRSDSYRRRGRAPQLSEEERAARLREMQMDAEVHEEQRWKRLKRADEDDAREASQAGGNSRGKSFLHSVQKSVYGAEKGGSSTIEESVRRRTHFLQGRTADEGNAFRR